MPNLKETIAFAIQAHSQTNATDKGGKTPYYWHLIRVMLRTKSLDEEVLMIAILHDVLEDTYVKIKDLQDAGYSQRVIDGVVWCSKNMFPDLSFKSWMKKISQEAPEEVWTVKFSDISDNLGFERMRGLMDKKPSGPKIQKNNKSTILKRIDKITRKQMRLHGEMGVYDRYYDAWNILCENEKALEISKNIISEDFCHLNQLMKLKDYLSESDFKSYLKASKIHTWKVSGELQEINDRAGNSYLAVNISNQIGLFYQNLIKNDIDELYLKNKDNRDKDQFHITIINAAQYSALKKSNSVEFNDFYKNNLNQIFDFYTYGIGSVQKNEKQAWFTVCEQMLLSQERKKLNLSHQDFHITLAFKLGDVHGVAKDKTSIIYDNYNLWDKVSDRKINLTEDIKLKIKKTIF